MAADFNTFGANIHTLLSHGFFMKDGLMGEFAKSKIDDVINYLNNKESEIKNDELRGLCDFVKNIYIDIYKYLGYKFYESNLWYLHIIRNK